MSLEFKIRRIVEILFWNNQPIEENHSNPQLYSSPTPFNDDLTSLSTAVAWSSISGTWADQKVSRLDQSRSVGVSCWG